MALSVGAEAEVLGRRGLRQPSLLTCSEAFSSQSSEYKFGRRCFLSCGEKGEKEDKPPAATSASRCMIDPARDGPRARARGGVRLAHPLLAARKEALATPAPGRVRPRADGQHSRTESFAPLLPPFITREGQRAHEDDLPPL